MIPAAEKCQYRQAAGAFFFLQGFVFLSWASRIPDIKKNLTLNDAELGFVFMVMPVAQFLTMAGAGYLISRKGSRWTLSLAAILYPALLAGIGMASSLTLLCLVLACFGILGNLSNLSVNTQGLGVERLYGKNIMSSFHGIWSLGALCGTGLGFLMIHRHIAPVPHFLIVWGLSIVLFLSMRRRLLPSDDVTGKGDSLPQARVRPEPLIILLGLIAFCGMVCEGTLVDWVGVYFSRVAGAASRITGLGLATFMTAMVLGRFIADRLASRFNTLAVIRLSGILATAGLLLIIFSPFSWLSLTGIFLTGLGLSSVVPLCYSLVGKSTHANPGVALSWVSSISFLGFFLGPPAVGFLSKMFDLRCAFGLTASLGVALTLLTLPVGKRLMFRERKSLKSEIF